jgi:hypothetical protein
MNILPFVVAAILHAPSPGFSPDDLWQSWPDQRFVRTPAPCLQPSELDKELQRLAGLYPDMIHVTEAGRSCEGRPIHLVRLGNGPRTVLLWSQMHGNEPSATPALLDIANFLLSRADEPEATAILDELTLLMIPMLNPDGTEVYQRRNAQGIDINRDALRLTTPEGRILKEIRDEYEPILGFNLHDQSRRTVVGDTRVLATNAVLAVAGDKEGTVTPGRLRAQRACAAIAETLGRFIPGGVARFDEDWSPRAFGDNMTAWGTPVVLIESGGLPPGHDLGDLTRLSFVAILTVLQGLAGDDLRSYDPRIYTELERSRRDAWADVVVRGGYIARPRLGPAYRADLAFNLETDDRNVAGCAADTTVRSRIVEVGDTRFLGAGRVIDDSESLLLAPFVAGIKGWSVRRWMSRDVLSDVTRLGVGTLVWEVPQRQVDSAEIVAGKLAETGLARIVVVPNPAEMPWLTLAGPPAQPVSNSLRDVVIALTGTRKDTGKLRLAWLQQPIASSRTPYRHPTVEPGQPASFVVLSPATNGQVDPETVRLSAVFIDGLEAKGISQ